MPEFTERQNAIIAALISNRYLRNAQLAEMLNVSAATIAADIAQLQKHFGCIRQAIAGHAKQAGWKPPLPPEPEETIERHIVRLIADSFPDGPLKPLATKSEALHHEVANLATQVWGECENQTPVTERMLNRFKARTARVRATLHQLENLIDEARKNS